MDEQSAAPAERAPETRSESIYIEGTALPAPASAGPLPEPERPGGIFGRLVNADDDIVGLVAYALYKQNKIDWVRAFEAERGRKPEAAEFSAYIVGENTPRRVSTYRFLAESTIARASGGLRRGNPMLSGTLNILYGLLGVVGVAAAIVLARFFFSMRH